MLLGLCRTAGCSQSYGHREHHRGEELLGSLYQTDHNYLFSLTGGVSVDHVEFTDECHLRMAFNDRVGHAGCASNRAMSTDQHDHVGCASNSVNTRLTGTNKMACARNRVLDGAPMRNTRRLPQGDVPRVVGLTGHAR